MTETAPLTGETLCRERGDCRLCGGGSLVLVLSLAPTPPANAFLEAANLDQEEPYFPLEVNMCGDCGHVQLRHVVDPALLFENYFYVSGTSAFFVAHLHGMARDLCKLAPLAPGGLVIDIGSNDGTLLAGFKAEGAQVLGIDPARAIAQQATWDGIETEAGFFTPDWAAATRGRRGRADIITANNVFAHVDDLAAVVRGVAGLLAPGGLFAFEVSYLVDVYEKVLFDTIYHEHLDYHTVKPLIGFFARHGLELIEAHRVPSHGGSFRGIAQLEGAGRPVGASVAAAVELEERLGLDRPDTLRAFGARIDRLGSDLGARLDRIKADGHSIAGFGAPAKATTLMHHFTIGPDVIDFIVDDAPLKQGLYAPGTRVPVVPPAALYERCPDYVIVLAWNFAAPIMEQHKSFLDQGGHFIVPLPEIEVF